MLRVMSERPSSQPPSGDQLERLRADYETAKAAVSEVGFTCEGSLIERYTCSREPQLPLRGPRAAPRPVLAAVLEGERQDDLAAVNRRGRRDLPGMDHQPPPPRSRARADARPLSDKQASRSSPAAADPPTAPHVHASGATQPPERPRNPGTSRYPRVVPPNPPRRAKVTDTRNFPLVLE